MQKCAFRRALLFTNERRSRIDEQRGVLQGLEGVANVELVEVTIGIAPISGVEDDERQTRDRQVSNSAWRGGASEQNVRTTVGAWRHAERNEPEQEILPR